MTGPSLATLDLRHLHALRAVVRHKTFHAAAAELGYTQSAVSQQIASLERTVGHELLHRPGGRRAADPTQAGWIVLAAADAVFARLGAAEADLRALSDGTTGTVRVAACATAATQVLPSVFTKLGASLPGVDVELHVRTSTAALERAVAFGEADLAISTLPVGDPLLEHHELFADRAVVLVRPDDELAGAGGLTAQHLRGRRLVGFFACRHEEQMENRLAELGVEPGISIRADDNATLLELVRSGTAVGVVPALAARDAGRDVIAVDASGFLPPRRCTVCWAAERPLSPAADIVPRLIVEAAPAAGVGARPEARPALQVLRNHAAAQRA